MNLARIRLQPRGRVQSITRQLDMVEKNEVALFDPASKYLPDITLPERNGRSITLIDLATHTSGLPFMPADAPPLNEPTAAKYSADDLKHYLAGYQLTRDTGSEWDYSNIGYWVLGEALVARAGKVDANLARTASPARTLIRQRILIPLKMTDTDFELSEKLKSNLAPGHARVAGVDWYWPERENPRRSVVPETVRLLAPFDPVVHDRDRFELLWNWTYRFEAYTPAPKRKLGYYVLPLLWRDRVIGWTNLTVKNGALLTDPGFVQSQPPRNRAFQRELDAELVRIRFFLGLRT